MDASSRYKREDILGSMQPVCKMASSAKRDSALDLASGGGPADSPSSQWSRAERASAGPISFFINKQSPRSLSPSLLSRQSE
jgi:hypothetical protein